MRYLALDCGLEKTGIALCDPEETLAYPLSTLWLKNFQKRAELLDRVVSIIQENSIGALVLGYPLTLENTATPMSHFVEKIAKRLLRRINLPLYFMPEYLTSDLAQNNLLSAGVRVKKIKQKIDQQAAVIILQSFLNLTLTERNKYLFQSE